MVNFLFYILLIIALSVATSADNDNGREINVQEAVNDVPNINIEYKPDDCQRQAKAGDFVVIEYVAYIPDEGGSDHYDDSVNKGPIYFKLHDPASVAMPGWHLGVDGMCVGEKRDVLIPAGDFTANHKLPNTKEPPVGKNIGYHFELKEIRDSPPTENLFKTMDFDENKEISKDEMRAYLSVQGLGGMEPGESLDQAIDNIFQNRDFDRSNSISAAEFEGRKHEEL